MKREFSKEETQMSKKKCFLKNLTHFSIRDFKLRLLVDFISTDSEL